MWDPRERGSSRRAGARAWARRRDACATQSSLNPCRVEWNGSRPTARIARGAPRPESFFSPGNLMHETINGLVASYGYALLVVLVGLESFGIPLPGETALVTAGAFAALGR